jgi:hypothetical protein
MDATIAAVRAQLNDATFALMWAQVQKMILEAAAEILERSYSYATNNSSATTRHAILDQLCFAYAGVRFNPRAANRPDRGTRRPLTAPRSVSLAGALPVAADSQWSAEVPTQ